MCDPKSFLLIGATEVEKRYISRVQKNINTLFEMTAKELKNRSVNYREKILQLYRGCKCRPYRWETCIDILNVLYNHVLNVSPANFSSPDRDRYIQSKGHTVEALYVVLSDKGFFPEQDLETLCRYQSNYIATPPKK